MLLGILKGTITLKTVTAYLIFNHVTLLICNRSNLVVQPNTGAEKKANYILLLGSVIALIFAITHLRLLRLELITEKDKLFSLSLLQLGQRWISMTRCMFTAL